eukprot:SAG22_NODE_1114_length_5527_cov_206.317797_4_plen_158_part_00
MRVAVTGATGLVGGILRQHWARSDPDAGPDDLGFDTVRLLDVQPIEPTDLHEREEFFKCDITDLAQLTGLLEGIDVVVHLAAYPGAGPGYELGDTLTETLLQLNIVGAYNAFEAAKRAGCSRLVFASSIGAVDGYRDAGQLRTGWEAPVFPTTACTC